MQKCTRVISLIIITNVVLSFHSQTICSGHVAFTCQFFIRSAHQKVVATLLRVDTFNDLYMDMNRKKIGARLRMFNLIKDPK